MDAQQQAQFAKDFALEVLGRHGYVGNDAARTEFMEGFAAKVTEPGTGATGSKLGGGDLTEIWNEALGLDPRTGQPVRPDLQPGNVVNTATADITKTTEHVGKTIPQQGVNK
jgi:hypothetical protein